MPENKTKPTRKSVHAFLGKVENERRRQDGFVLLDMMTRITGEKAVMWGDSMVGFGRYHYRYRSGHEGEYFLTGFSPRKTSLSIYILAGLDEHEDLLEKLGPHKTGVGCLYINRLDRVDLKILEKLIDAGVKSLRDSPVVT